MAGHRTGLAAVALYAALLIPGCTGGSESNAAQDEAAAAESAAQQEQRQVNARQEIESIHRAIPIYQGAAFREDLTRRDEVTVRSRYGPGAEVYTLATDDSFPQVYHYYTTYLAQFRGFPSQNTYPPQKEDWRTLEVKLNEAMQDPFIPGQNLDPNGKQVTLQIAETEAEPKTVIRYIVTPAPPMPVTTASSASQPEEVAAP